MKTFVLTSVLTLFAALPLTAVSGVRNDASDALIESAVQNEARDRAIDYALAPIKSETDLRSHLLKNDPHSPLNLLSERGKSNFAGSLKFNEKGLTTYDYSDLRAELTASQVYQVLALFGAQRTTSVILNLRVLDAADKAIAAPRNNLTQLYPDHFDYLCESRATCSASLNKICTGNC